MLREQKFHINSDYGKVAELNSRVKLFLELDGLEDHLCNAVEICMTEALNNVIKHSYNNDSTKPIDVEVKKDSKYFEITIIDEGRKRENMVVKDLDFDPNDINNLPESGMGLFLIKQLMDEMKYYSKDGRNYFTIKKWLI